MSQLRRVLITGPSGAGKTHLARFFRNQGVNAIDADDEPGLSAWLDSNKRVVEAPGKVSQSWFDEHEFIWYRDKLERLLNEQDSDVYYFGLSGNTFDVLDLFTEFYFLDVSDHLVLERLSHESRSNQFGREPEHQQAVLDYKKEIESIASKHGFTFIDASQSPEVIFSLIRQAK